MASNASDALRQHNILEALMKAGTGLVQELDEETILERILEGVKAVGFDRVRLYLLSEDRSRQIGKAQTGMDETFVGLEWAVNLDAHTSVLLAHPSPQIFRESPECPDSFKDLLGKGGVKEWAEVPLVVRGTVIGKVSADNKFSQQPIRREVLELVALFANQAAAALEKARLLEEARKRADDLEALRTTTMALSSAPDRAALLPDILRRAVGLLKAGSGGLYEYYSERGELRLIADDKRPEQVGNILRVGEGMAGRLVQGNEPHLIVGDYNQWPGRAAIYAGKRIFGAVLAVPLRFSGTPLGVLYVDDSVGRRFSLDDAHLLSMFAAQAAIALHTSALMDADVEKAERLENLCSATAAIMKDLENTPLPDRLTDIARRVADLVEAESCAVLLVDKEGRLSWEANYGHRPGMFEKGRKFPVRGGPGAGLTGHMAYEGKVCNLVGEQIVNHPARVTAIDSAPSLYCHSILGIPLRRRVGQEEKLVGFLRATNKKNKDGEAVPPRGFTAEDENIMKVFAEAIVVAIDNAGLVAETQERTEFLKGLIAYSPAGIVAVDGRGCVTEFNPQAESVVGYTAAEVLGKSIKMFFPRGKAAEIGMLLRKGQKVVGYETEAVSKSKETIPIRVSAANWPSGEGKRLATVGYCEDLRPRKAAERRQELLLKAIDTVAQAGDPPAAMESLARTVVCDLAHTFCQILLLDEAEQRLGVFAAYTIPRSEGELAWDPNLGKWTRVSDWPGLERVLGDGRARVVNWTDSEVQPYLEKIADLLKLPKRQRLHSLLLVPLTVGNRTVGLLVVGETRERPESQFTEENIGLAANIAAQVTVLIEPMRRYTLAQKRNTRLNDLRKATEALSQASTLPGAADRAAVRAVLETIVDRAKEMFEADCASLWPYDATRDSFIPAEMTARGMPDAVLEKIRAQEPRPGHTTYTVIEQGRLDVDDISSQEGEILEPGTRESLMQIEIRSFRGICLRAGNEPLGVLYLSYKQRGALSNPEYCLEHFAAAAAIALKNARLLDRIAKGQRAAEVVAQVMAAGDLDQTLEAVARGIKDVLRCDVVALFTYDPSRGRIDHPPKLVGATGSEAQPASERIKPDSLLHGILHQSGPCIVENTAADVLFRGRTFARQEHIESCIAFPLRAGDQTVGAMFVNYRTHRRFTAEEVTTGELFANQAAVAIRSSREHEDKAREQEALGELAEAALKVSSSQEILDRAVEIAARLLDTDFCEVVLPNSKNELTVTAVYGWEPEAVGRKLAPRTGSQTGFTILQQDPVVVPDYHQEQRFRVHPDIETKKIRSGLSVPLVQDGSTVGAMLVHTQDLRGFAEREIRVLSLIADQTAIALKSAQRYEAIGRNNARLEVLYGAAHAITEGFGGEEKEVLDRIIEHVVEHIKVQPADKPSLGTIQLYDAVNEELAFESVCPSERLDDLVRQLGRKLPVGRRVPAGGRMGINGRAARTARPQLVDDVREDPDYVEFLPSTRSELAVPLKDRGAVVGVLALESARLSAFDPEDSETLENLAELVVIAMENARQFTELRKVKKAAEAVAKAVAQGDLRATLDSIASAIKEALGCDAVVLYACDPTTNRLQRPPSQVGVSGCESVKVPPTYSKSSLVYRILDRGKARIVPDVGADTDFRNSRFVSGQEIKSCAAVPLRAVGNKVGVLFVNYRTRHDFSTEEQANIELFANQAAVAIRNAQILADLQRTREHLVALNEAGKAITARPGAEREVVLGQIAQQVVECLKAPAPQAPLVAAIQLYDQEAGALAYESGYPPEGFAGLIGKRQVVDRRRARGPIGISVRTVRTRRPQRVDDVTKDPDYVALLPDTRSMMTAPLLHQGAVLGVLSVEGSCPAAFDDEDLKTLAALADLAVIAIENSRQFTELKRVKGLVGTRTALAWMGMMSSIWRHGIEINAATIRNQAELLREEVRRLRGGKPLLSEINRIIRSAKEILKKRPVSPLGVQAEATAVPLRGLVEDWARRWRGRLAEQSVSLQEHLTLEPEATVRAGPEWLHRAWDLLIENAVAATCGRAGRQIRLTCLRAGPQHAELFITDNGPGIPEELNPIILREVIPHKKSKGFGVGLLLAQTIIETYEGELKVDSTGPQGTTIKVSLPLEESDTLPPTRHKARRKT